MTPMAPSPSPIIPKLNAVPVTINDHAMLERAYKMANAAGRKDWRVWLADLAQDAIKARLGIRVDLTMSQAATYLNLHRNSLWNYHKRGLLPDLYYTSSRRAMVPVANLDALKNRTVVIRQDMAA